jgi:NOL1/NOP2/sun family putative RNA methylase
MNLPEDFKQKMQDMLGEDWERFLEGYEQNRFQAFRLNPLKKGFTEELAESLRKRFGAVEAVPWEKNGYYYSEETRPGKHAYHEAGLYYIQEPSAMSAAALLSPQPGMRVLDLCAAPGGKTTQLAASLRQTGLLVANEIHPARCKILSQNVERMGIANAIVTNEDSGKLAEHFPAFFHAILVDAPCSGEGMFRKNPEAMEEWSAEQVLVCARRQREILENAAAMLLPGGTLCYSTCTFSREENEENIDWFLEHHPEFSVKDTDAPWFEKDSRQKTFRLWPHKLHGEGHFAAVLIKEGTLPALQADGISDRNPEIPGRSADRKQKYTAGKQTGAANEPDRMQRKLLEEFLQETLVPETGAWILNGTLTLFGEQLYRLPENTPDLRGIRVLRAGLHIGEFKKNRFEPSHALALFLGKDEVNCSISLQADAAGMIGYLRGESVFLTEEDRLETTGKAKGWCLLCVDSCSVGWGKLAGNQIKNHYPKGLRRDIN